jgi:hypothetical protein
MQAVQILHPHSAFVFVWQKTRHQPWAEYYSNILKMDRPQLIGLELDKKFHKPTLIKKLMHALENPIQLYNPSDTYVPRAE